MPPASTRSPGMVRGRSSPPPLPKTTPPPLPDTAGAPSFSAVRAAAIPRPSSEPPRNPSSSPTKRDIIVPAFGDAQDDAAPPDEDPIGHVDGPISTREPIAKIGRYALFEKFASGGMATVHLGRLDGAGGFTRVVAIKRLLPHLVQDGDFAEMLLKEARLAARVRHPNVVPTLDVVASKGEVLLVLEYVHGESLSALCRAQAKRNELIPLSIVVSVMMEALEGLHSVHEATDERGRSLGMVHRDVSPPNVIVGVDGMARVLDFGIVKALEQLEETVPNRLKGKTGYMSPEQIRAERLTRASDIFAAGIVLWEMLTLRRFASGAGDKERIDKIMAGNFPNPSDYRPELTEDMDRIVMRALAFEPTERYATAREFAAALGTAAEPASAGVVADWVRSLAEKTLAERARLIAQVENWAANAPEIELNSTPFAVERDVLALASLSGTPAPVGEVQKRVVKASDAPDSKRAPVKAAAASDAKPAKASAEPQGGRFPMFVLVAALAVIAVVAAYMLR
ncbi:MAG TPA: serine/threonine-protein kinase [Polyangiaceae bacterium]|nr:serine/threonine-protein kinase [Polyangiaceae bacterium]